MNCKARAIGTLSELFNGVPMVPEYKVPRLRLGLATASFTRIVVLNTVHLYSSYPLSVLARGLCTLTRTLTPFHPGFPNPVNKL
jgi:hypothetical protein